VFEGITYTSLVDLLGEVKEKSLILALIGFDSFFWICQHDSNISLCVPSEFVRDTDQNGSTTII